jgi:hypothetical protein
VIPAGGGETDGKTVLGILSTHPATAHFVSHKLCRYFLGACDAADRWTERMTATYLATSGDIKSMLRPLLLSDDLVTGPPVLKRPFDFAVSALRALNADTNGNKPLQDHLGHMGQPLYQWPMPDGYPDKTAAWTGSLLARWNFALALTTGGIGGTTVDLPGLLRVAGAFTSRESADALVQMILARRATSPADARLRDRIAKYADDTHSSHDANRSAPAEWASCAALVLASPEFQWR